MNISKKSWHYKLNDKFKQRYYMPNSLCGYFWFTIWTMAKVLAVAGICTYFLGAMTVGLFMQGDYHDVGITAWEIIGILSAIIGILVGIYFLLEWNQKRKHFKSYKEPKKYIVFEYIKAVKSKICPLITYTDEKNPI